MKSINPFTGNLIQEYREHTAAEAGQIVEEVYRRWLLWKETSFEYRAGLMKRVAAVLRDRKDEFARMMTLEMGKLYRESVSEIEKCAWVCDHYADHASQILQDEMVVTDAAKSYIAFQPLGVVLAVMPWNFPFWQVFRFAAPALMAGNCAVLKHASNVPGCAMAIEQIFVQAGLPEQVFRTLMIPSQEVEAIILHPRIVAVTLTGSELAGSKVAAAAGRCIKKSVLELGGSDAFIVLDDADLVAAVTAALTARMINQGQSCIAAKRFIVMDSVVKKFESALKESMERLQVGDPLDSTTHVAPLARRDLVDDLERQVNESIKSGARLVLGGNRLNRPGFYFEPTILADVKKGMAVYSEETFGPVVAIIPVTSEQDAIDAANDSEFGLGGCVWTRDPERGERVARKVATGAMFVNGFTKSDPRIPFGGIKKSGYGRELGSYGIKEFVNCKTIWIS